MEIETIIFKGKSSNEYILHFILLHTNTDCIVNNISYTLEKPEYIDATKAVDFN